MKRKTLLMMLLMALFMPWAANAQDPLTVYDGTETNATVPFYGLYGDYGTRSQFIIPAEQLEDMNGGTIQMLTFYSTLASQSYDAGVTVYLKEVDYTVFETATLEDWSSMTAVWTGNLTVSDNQLEIDFSNSYTYNGGNLMIGFQVTDWGTTYKSIAWNGVNQSSGTYTAAYNNANSSHTWNASVSRVAFIPKTTFTYTAGSGPVCDKPETPEATNVEAHSATLTWSGGSGTYNTEIKEGSGDWTSYSTNTTATTANLTSLVANTTYQFRVQSVCSGSTSSWKVTTFTTPIACPAPTELTVTLTPGDGSKATFAWTETGSATSWQLCLNGDEDNLIPVSTNPFTYNGFTPEMTYTAKVRAYCNSIDQSEWSNTVTFTPTDAYSITVNDGEATNEYVPFYGYYADSGCQGQFIIPATDLAAIQWGTITRLTFYVSSPASATFVSYSGNIAMFEVYMQEVDETTISTTTPDWGGEKVMNEAQLVIEGSQMVVTLDAPYEYAGGNLMIGFKETNNGGYAHTYWYGVEATGASIGGYGTSLSQRNFLPKTTFSYIPGEEPSCLKPTSLAVNYEGGTTATVSWAGTASSFEIDYNGTVITGITGNSYQLSNLDFATVYEVKVRANCGSDGYSDWTSAVSFRTDFCLPDDQCELTFIVTDSYGDSWNGNAILVLDYETYMSIEDDDAALDAALIASITNEDLDGTNGEETQTITLAVCDGRDLIFAWQTGNYVDEVSYQIIDNVGDVIEEGDGAAFEAFAYTIACNSTCRKPTDFAASEIAGRSATLSWTENGEATSWTIAYMAEDDEEVTYIENVTANPYFLEGLTPVTRYYAMVKADCEDMDKWSDVITFKTQDACPKPVVSVDATPNSATVTWTGSSQSYDLEWAVVPTGSKDPYSEEGWYYYDNGSYAGSVGLGGGQFYWGVMFPAGTFEGTALTAVKAYDINAMVGELIIYNDGTTAPSNQISIQDIEFTGAGEWVEFALQDVTVDPTKNVWVVFNAADGAAYPIGTSNDDNGDANGRWVEINGTWYDMADVGVTGRANMVRAHFEEGYDPSELEWVAVPGVTSPYTIEGLQPGTTYTVRVKGDCGEEGESAWTTVTFTTPDACTTPINLTADPVTATSAVLSWSNYQDSYNVQYRRAEYNDYAFFEDFEGGDMPEGWTIVDGDGDGYNWEWNNQFHAHSGVGMLYSASYINNVGALTPDNWLITPQLDLQGTMSIWMRGQNTDTYYAEHVAILLSTTTADTTNFTVTLWEGETTDEYLEYTADLSSYAGQQGYIAIRHYNVTDMFYLDIDDFGIIAATHPAEEWTTVVVDQPTYTATGLTPGLLYEWQVQGVNKTCEGGVTEWTEVNTFTTLEGSEEEDQTITLPVGWGWFSSYIEYPADALEQIQNDIALTSTTATIKGQYVFTNLSNNLWSGELDALVNEEMYLIKSAGAETSLTGPLANPTEHPITLKGGWNWIGFISSEEMEPAEALASITPAVNDIIKGQLYFSTYTASDGWVGQLQTMVPGEGYIYKHLGTDEPTLVYPTKSKGAVVTTPVEKYWNANYREFPTNLSMMVTLDGQYGMFKGSHEIGAFVDGECRGSARLQEVGGKYIAFLSVSGNEGEEVCFKLFDVTNNKEYSSLAAERIVYSADAIYGSVNEPMTLHFNMTGVEEYEGYISLFPNPAKDKVMVNGNGIQTLKVYNAMGQLIYAEDCSNAEQVELNLGSFSSGVYTVNVVMTNGQTVNKMMVKE